MARGSLTASEDKTARLWEAASGKELAVLRGHEGRVVERGVLARWRADADRVGGQDGAAVGRGERARSWPSCAAMRAGCTSAAFSPDGARSDRVGGQDGAAVGRGERRGAGRPARP